MKTTNLPTELEQCNDSRPTALNCFNQQKYASHEVFKSLSSMIRPILLVMSIILGGQLYVHGQSCDYQTGEITFNASGQNATDLYTTTYALTDVNGNITALSNQTTFTIDVEGFYTIYGVNFKSDTTVEGLSVGSNIYVVTGDCVDVSQPFMFTVCEALDPCNYCLGESVVLETAGGNGDPTFETRYLLTDKDGVILDIQDNSDWGQLEVGLYVAFAINYDAQGTIEGLEIGGNISDIRSTCHDISAGLVVGVCQALDPTIFFDLKGCDITQTAILQVGEVYDSYEWSTGSTASFIEVNANTPATYTVTVGLASGCIGVVRQEITGNEVATIGDYVWEDLDGDGMQDADEPGINGVTVNLYTDFNSDGRPDIDGFPSCIATTSNNPTTGQPGYYNFNVYEAFYIIEFIGPDGFTITPPGQGGDRTIDSDVNPATGLTNTIRILEGDMLDDIDAGFFTSSGFGGIVWNDINGNGVFEEGEEGINDVVINLYDESGELVSTIMTSTDENTGEVGAYCFDELPPSAYYAEIILPDGNVLSPPNRRADEEIDSDADGSNGPNTTMVVDLMPGEKVGNIDFGTYLGGRICGIVWQETGAQENSTYDEGVDELLENTQLELISIDNNSTVVAVASTDENGAYCFEEVPMGSYQIRPRTSSAGGSYVDVGVGDDPLLDSDVDPNTITTEVFFLDPGEEMLGINAGLRFGALPIDLISFSGNWDRTLNRVVLEWSTALEINNEKFIIERVVGDQAKFEAIGEVAGAGNSSAILDYDYSDLDIALSADYYYRLKQVDYDGGYAYSDIIVVTIERNASVDLQIYPNPAVNFVTVDINIDEGALSSAQLTDVRGRLVRTWSGQGIYKGNSAMTLDIEDVPVGQYMLTVKVGTKTHHSLLLITK